MSGTKLLIATLGALTLLAPQTFAMGSDDGIGGKPKPPKCKSGYIYSEKKKRCVRQDSRHLDPRDLIRTAWSLSYAGHHRRAIALFERTGAGDDPEVLNGLGFNHRKLGNVSLGLSFYGKALSIEPDYVLARAYRGEAYVLTGRVDLARAELAKIANRCGKACREYVYLYRAIETGQPNDW